MKKLLSILGAIGMMASTGATAMTAVSCGDTKEDKNNPMKADSLDKLINEGNDLIKRIQSTLKNIKDPEHETNEEILNINKLMLEQQKIMISGIINFDTLISFGGWDESSLTIETDNAVYTGEKSEGTIVYIREFISFINTAENPDPNYIKIPGMKDIYNQMISLGNTVKDWFINKFTMNDRDKTNYFKALKPSDVNGLFVFWDNVIKNTTSTNQSLIINDFTTDEASNLFVMNALFTLLNGPEKDSKSISDTIKEVLNTPEAIKELVEGYMKIVIGDAIKNTQPYIDAMIKSLTYISKNI